MVDIYYQSGYDVYYVPSFCENLSSNNCNTYPVNCNIFYNITTTYTSNESSYNNVLEIYPESITNINSTTFDVNSLKNAQLNTTISLSNNTILGNNVTNQSIPSSLQ